MKGAVLLDELGHMCICMYVAESMTYLNARCCGHVGLISCIKSRLCAPDKGSVC